MAEDPSLHSRRPLLGLAFAAIVLSACVEPEREEPQAVGAAITLPPESGCSTAIFRRHEYWFCPAARTATQAGSLCSAQPWMHLVRIDDVAERNFLEAHFSGQTWIGGSDELTEGSWRWLDNADPFWSGGASGSAVAGRYNDWHSGQPDNVIGVSVPPAVTTQLWDPAHSSITNPVGGCTIQAFGDSAYWTCTSLLNWDTARSRCTTAGADLASITSSAESTFVNDIATGTSEWLLGLQKRGLTGAPVGTWRWLDGGNPITGFSNWGFGEPGSSDCGAMENDLWKDWACSSSRAFICEDTSVLPIPDVQGPQLVDLMSASRRFVGSTAALTNGVNVSSVGCGASASARDAVFWFSLGGPTPVSIDLTSSTFSSAVVALFKDTLDSQGYAAAGSRCAVRASGSTVELSNVNLAAGNYYAIITSTSSSGTGTYDVKFDGVPDADCTLATDGAGWSDDACNNAAALRGYLCESDVSNCTVGVDGDGDGVPDCFDGCPEDASHQSEGQCGCPSSPASAGTQCDDGICAANHACDGAGNCGQPSQCAPDTHCSYERLGASGYYFCDNPRTADEARAQCALEPGMHLVHVESEAENDFLVDHIDDASWLDATDSSVEGHWIWADDGTQFWQGGTAGGPVAGRFSDWLNDHAPDNLDGLGWPIADCAALEGGLPGPVQTHAWSDFACDDARQEFAFTCEVPLAQDCLLSTDLDGDGTLDCRDTCPLDPNKIVPGDCGCANAPLPSGTACDDGWCAANNACNGAGTCGNASACAPTTGCTPMRNEGKVYWFCTTTATWTQARDLCRSKPGLELVRIDDGAENAFVAANVGATAWTGANDRSVNNTWRWAQNPNDNGAQFWSGTSSGSPSNGLYNKWASGEPGSAFFDCGQMLTSGSWRDESCTGSARFVCETVLDNCGLDLVKFEPGACGCGVPDTDSDNDGSPNCIDQCPSDPAKTEPLWCGCGQAETDGDGDETPNCVDACPTDPGKVAAGICGCGIADDDSDGDGTLDCQDLCPEDPLKSAPGTCGCGLTDVDTDDDDTADCVDLCPLDSEKVHPGSCGCGVLDVDSDGDLTLDCFDECPNDVDKVIVGDCGCADAAVPAGTACDDGLCAANHACDGSGRCGSYAECSPQPACTIVRVSGRLYFHCPGPYTWDAAEAACAASGFDQVRIDSAAEDANFDALGGERWLGARDYSEGTWAWQDNGDTFWSGGPEGMAIGGRFADWGTEQPDDLYGAIVYPPAATLTQLWDEFNAGAVKPTGTCNGFIRGAELYWMCTNLLNWDTARSRCITAGSNLVSINDSGENGFVAGLAGAGDTQIGVQKKGLAGAPSGTWQWLDGTSPNSGYTHWGTFEPGSSDCGAINSGFWKDWTCTISSLKWICERPTPALPVPRLGAPQSVAIYGAQRRFRGNTSGMESSVDGTIMTGCGAGSSAPDAIFSFTVTERTHLTIDLTGSETGTRVGIFKSAISAQGFIDAGNECVSLGTLLQETLDPGNYYAVLTSSGSNSRAYEVLFSGVRQGQPGADCAMLKTGKWIDTECSETHAYSCEVPIDECPADGSKLTPGLCGCGNPDADGDGDGTPDCADHCPLDAHLLEPGECGCASTPRLEGTACGTGLCPANDACDGEGRCGDPTDCAPASGCVFAEYAGMAARGYFFCSNALSWQGAASACESQPRMTLARIGDPTENTFIRTNQGAASWIGASDRVHEGQWYWRDAGHDEGTQFWTGDENGHGTGGLYTNWDGFQPNDLLTQDCGEMQTSGLWNDDACNNSKFYVCEVGADLCPDDWNKWEPGECGCGVPEGDSDGDGVKDCFDSCPYDAARDLPADGHCAFTLAGDSIARADRTVISHAGAVDQDGQTLFVWQADVDDHSEIQGRLFDENGTPLDWTPIVIDPSIGLGWAAEPRVAARPGGGFVVVWTDEDGDADQSGIVYRTVTSDGTLGNVRVANQDEAFFQWGARVAALADGFVVVWVDQQTAAGPDTGTVLRMRRFDAGGRALGGAVTVAETVAGDQLTPEIAAAGQQWMIVWADLDTGDLLGRRFANGAPGEELVIAEGAHSPAVTALTAPGDFAVAWADATAAIYAAKVPAGLGVGAPVRVPAVVDGRPEELPSSAVLSGDVFMVAWQYGDGHRDSDFAIVDPLNLVPTLPAESVVRGLLTGPSNQSQVVLVPAEDGIWVSYIDDGLGFGEGEAQLAAYFLPAP